MPKKVAERSPPSMERQEQKTSVQCPLILKTLFDKTCHTEERKDTKIFLFVMLSS